MALVKLEPASALRPEGWRASQQSGRPAEGWIAKLQTERSELL